MMILSLKGLENSSPPVQKRGEPPYKSPLLAKENFE
jgi:hypothetical protein